jgi:hypothetical protein
MSPNDEFNNMDFDIEKVNDKGTNLTEGLNDVAFPTSEELVSIVFELPNTTLASTEGE